MHAHGQQTQAGIIYTPIFWWTSSMKGCELLRRAAVAWEAAAFVEGGVGGGGVGGGGVRGGGRRWG